MKTKMNKPVTLKGFIIGLVCILGIVALLGFVTNGFSSWSKDTVKDKLSRNLNEDNLYTVDCVTLEDSNLGNGVVVDVDEDTGVISLSGTPAADHTYTVGTIKLDKGTYTITAIEGAALNTVYMTLKESGGNEHQFDFTPGNTITIGADDTECTLEIHVKADAELGSVKILPVIVSGDEAGEFYA